MSTRKLRDENNEIDKAENEINRRMAEGYQASKKSRSGKWMTITSPDGKQKIRAFVYPK